MLVAINGPAMGDERLVRLAAPEELVESGLFKFVLPRFSLKTQVRVQIVAPGEIAEAEIGSDGVPVFEGLGQRWGLHVVMPEHTGAERFADWLTSEAGQRAITGYAPDGAALFTLPSVDVVAEAAPEFNGDAEKGRDLARKHCGRCHVSVAGEVMLGIGSTPSFFVLRSLGDWSDRFSIFYVLNPHPSFTQIDGVTEPFPIDRPSPIHPVSMTLDDLDAILAYVAELEPADLGAPIQSQ